MLYKDGYGLIMEHVVISKSIPLKVYLPNYEYFRTGPCGLYIQESIAEVR